MPKIPARQTAKASGGAPRAAGRKAPARRLGGRVSTRALTQFTSQLSTLQDAGLPIVRSLKILEGQMDRGPFKAVLAAVTEEVEAGTPLSDALSRHTRVFDPLYTNMVKAGEAGGVLDVILSRLASFMEKAERLRKRVKGAMIYPIVVLFITFSILLGIMIFIVPKFEEVFRSQPGLGELPALTRSLQSFSKFLVNRWYVVIGGFILLVVIWRAIKATAGGRRLLDRLSLNVPLIGSLVRRVVIARFSRTLGTLIASGVPILESLEICKNTAGNSVMADALAKVHESIREGGSIAEPLGDSGLCDDVVTNMVDVGEETGELDKMLIRVADTYDEEVDIAVSSLVSIIEPILIVFLGGAVMVIVLALFMPLIKLVEGVGEAY